MKNFDKRLVSGATDQGPVRANNQDAFFMPQDSAPVHLGALYLVADGVGGQEFGATAAQMAARVVSEAFYQKRTAGTDVQPALKEAIYEANRAIVAEARARAGGRMGTTIVAAVQQGSMLYVAHVGDARAYLLHDDRLERLTRDDTWVQLQVEAGVLTPEEAANHEFRNVVTQVLGNKLEIDVHLATPRELHPGDILLLCSDGLYDPVSDARVAEILREQRPQVAADALVAEAVMRSATDNITAVVVHAGHETGTDPLPANSARRPAWIPVAGGAVLFAAVLLAGFIFWQRGRNIGNVTASSAPLPLRDDGSALPTATSSPAPRPSAATTAVATAPSTPPAAASLSPTPTPLPLVCVQADTAFVWRDADLDADCQTGSATAATIFEKGRVVQLLPDPPRTVRGPDITCLEGEYHKVRTLEETPQTVGWILATSFVPMPTEGCDPP